MGKSLIITTGGGTDIEEGSPNARPGTILQGYSLFVGPTDDPVIGTMPTPWADGTQKLDPGGHLNLTEGYYTGGLSCTGKSLKDFTSATATAEQMQNGKTGWRNGAKQTGSMIWIGAGGGTLSANGTHTVSKGQYDGKGEVTQSLSTKAATNVTPGTSKKTIVAASKWVTGKQVVLGDANLTAGNIKKDVTIFGVKGTWIVDSRDLVSGVYLIRNGEIELNGTVTRSNEWGSGDGGTGCPTGLNSSIWNNLRNQVQPPYKDGNCLVFTTMHWDLNAMGADTSNKIAYSTWNLNYKYLTAIDGNQHFLYADIDKLTWTIVYKYSTAVCNWFGNIISTDRYYWIAGKYTNTAAGNNAVDFMEVASSSRWLGNGNISASHANSCVKGRIGYGYKAKAKSGVSYDPNDCYVEHHIRITCSRAYQLDDEGDLKYGSRNGVITKLWVRNIWEQL